VAGVGDWTIRRLEADDPTNSIYNTNYTNKHQGLQKQFFLFFDIQISYLSLVSPIYLTGITLRYHRKPRFIVCWRKIMFLRVPKTEGERSNFGFPIHSQNLKIFILIVRTRQITFANARITVKTTSRYVEIHRVRGESRPAPGKGAFFTFFEVHTSGSAYLGQVFVPERQERA